MIKNKLKLIEMPPPVPKVVKPIKVGRPKKVKEPIIFSIQYGIFFVYFP